MSSGYCSLHIGGPVTRYQLSVLMTAFAAEGLLPADKASAYGENILTVQDPQQYLTTIMPTLYADNGAEMTAYGHLRIEDSDVHNGLFSHIVSYCETEHLQYTAWCYSDVNDAWYQYLRQPLQGDVWCPIIVPTDRSTSVIFTIADFDMLLDFFDHPQPLGYAAKFAEAKDLARSLRERAKIPELPALTVTDL